MKLTLGALLLVAGLAMAARDPGVKKMHAYYDGKIFIIQFRQLPSSGEHDPSFNIIYQCDACVGQIEGGNFISVLDALEGDGFHPLWAAQQITFTDDNTPHQFLSDEEILRAEANGEITITNTGEIFSVKK